MIKWKDISLIIEDKDLLETGFVVYRNRRHSIAVQMCNGENPKVQLPQGWKLYGVYPMSEEVGECYDGNKSGDVIVYQNNEPVNSIASWSFNHREVTDFISDGCEDIKDPLTQLQKLAVAAALMGIEVRLKQNRRVASEG